MKSKLDDLARAKHIADCIAEIELFLKMFSLDEIETNLMFRRLVSVPRFAWEIAKTVARLELRNCLKLINYTKTCHGLTLYPTANRGTSTILMRNQIQF